MSLIGVFFSLPQVVKIRWGGKLCIRGKDRVYISIGI